LRLDCPPFQGTPPAIALAPVVRITSYPELDISVPFDWNAAGAEVNDRVRTAMKD